MQAYECRHKRTACPDGATAKAVEKKTSVCHPPQSQFSSRSHIQELPEIRRRAKKLQRPPTGQKKSFIIKKREEKKIRYQTRNVWIDSNMHLIAAAGWNLTSASSEPPTCAIHLFSFNNLNEITRQFCLNFCFILEKVTCSVLKVASCLLHTIYDIFDTQENERRFDDKTKWTELFHKGADFCMRLGVGGRVLVIFRQLRLKTILWW